MKEIGISTAKKWSKAMGYKHATCLNKVIRRIKKNMPEKLKIYNDRTPKQFEAL
ncbi:MAG: hypothetical protein P8Y70_02145 [Candidatus Lokiarchaeota archaeon]